MASMTVWPARRVGDRILCGRPAPNGGCRGEIATVFRLRDGLGEEAGQSVLMPSGITRAPDGEWVRSARATRKRADGRKPEPRPHGLAAELPFRRRCPVCNVLAEVGPDLLPS